MRACRCGGVIREAGKPFWDILPSCTCANPVMVNQGYTVYTTGTAALSPLKQLKQAEGTPAKEGGENTSELH